MSSLSFYPVFVDNISNRAQIADLRHLFSRYGRVVEVTIISNHGFVNFDSAEDALKAIDKLHGYSFFGHRLSVEVSKELSEFLRRKERQRRQQRSRSKERHKRRRTSRSRSTSGRRSSESRKVDERRPSRRSSSAKSEEEELRPAKRAVRLASTDGKTLKIRVDGGQVETAEQPEGDLRDVLRKRKSSGASSTSGIQVKIDDATDERQVVSTSSDKQVCAENVQELYVGNLFKSVEKEDIERLLGSYGNVLYVKMFATHALVRVECSVETAQEAIKNLDFNQWMDNAIRVKFCERPIYVKEPPKHFDHCTRVSPQESRGPNKTKIVNTTAIEDFIMSERRKDEQHEQQRGEPSKLDATPKKDKKIKVRTMWAYTPAVNKKTFLADMTDVFKQYGEVQSSVWDSDVQKVVMELKSSERQAVRCVEELNKIRYKAQELRVKFGEGTEEDTEEFRRQYFIQLRSYPKQLVPGIKVAASTLATKTDVDLPIGVLPPASSLGAFAKLPDSNALTSIIQNVRKSMPQMNEEDAFNAYEVPTTTTPNSKSFVGPQPLPIKGTPSSIASVEGEVHSVSNRIILVHFHIGSVLRLAKLVPGQMYVDGKKSLGYIIKNNTFHMWPANIRQVLQQHYKVKMDVRLLSDGEKAEVKEMCNEHVDYEAPLLWRANMAKPTEMELVDRKLNNTTRVFKGTVVSLYPKWGVLRCPKAGGEVFFENHTLFVDNQLVPKHQSLLRHVEVGDTLAVLCLKVDYLEMTEVARNTPGFDGRTDTLKYRAKVVWNVTAEVDPHVVKDPEADSEPACNFLISSLTLAKPLPSEKEAQCKNLLGFVEEIHLPAGGVITLTDNSLLEDQRHVYFHRSRLYMNGSKIQSSSSLDEALIPGDKVSVDVIPNYTRSSTGLPDVPYVASHSHSAYWVALSVRTNTTERGVSIAKSLRMENVDQTNTETNNICAGRIVHFHRPEPPTGPVTSGIAIIDSGQYAGQRLEFEASECYAYGYCLQDADLSQVFSYDEPVYIQVKPYNSYCADKLWIGQDVKSHGYDQEGQMALQKYLFDHGLDRPAFDGLIRGIFPTRPFIPLGGQKFRGRIKGLKSDLPDGSSNKVVIEADVGDLLFVEADRTNVYVFGHWMGKADLQYVLDHDEVHFEFHPVFEKSDQESVHDLPKASLVWLGQEDARPNYLGQGSTPVITAKMDSLLWQHVRSKNMDEKMFRALVEGRLPPKQKDADVASTSSSSTTTSDGIPLSLDKETLAQAALLQQMKTQFGSKACLQAMMVLLGGGDANSSEDKSPPDAANVLKLAQTLQQSKKD